MDAVCSCTYVNKRQINKLFIISLLFVSILAKKHTQIFKEDSRSLITLTTFGFASGSYLYVNVSRLIIVGKDDPSHIYGFTLDKSMTNGASPIMEDQINTCHLNKSGWNAGNASVVYFVIDFKNSTLLIDRSHVDLKNLYINLENLPEEDSSNSTVRSRRHVDILSDAYLLETPRRRFRRQAAAVVQSTEATTSLPPSTTTSIPRSTPSTKGIELSPGSQTSISIMPIIPIGDGAFLLSFHFKVRFTRPEELGLYNFIFHNCRKRSINMTITLEERNPGSYLSLGQQPLPTLFFVFCVVYAIVGSFWLWVLCSSTEGVFKIHYLMLALMYVKALAMLFHGVNFYFISVEGHEEEAFAVLYYIMYLIKGIFMFVTIVLIGAGWTFVKHVLSDRDKKIFVVVIPLQILANVARIIIEESDVGMTYYDLYQNVFLVVDLICCGAILFPVIWSIRHLQQASQTDGKAAINLEKLKIFRHFYILVVCYIYFTRIIVLLVRIAVQFQYEWLDPLFVELATLAFFVLTGYKFRPASNNPYLQLSQSDDEEEMDEVLTQSGALESVTKVNNKTRMLTTEFSDTVKQRESSHEYD